ncbi:MAG: extracellular solute-binding protein [Rhodospirillaceae bacterium]|nr:extracellular solute-binding protein [Rhodospirillaceae bacterium]
MPETPQPTPNDTSAKEAVAPTQTNAAAAQRRSKALTTFFLAAALSATLIALLLGYLIFAPAPIDMTPSPGAAVNVTPAAPNTIRLVAPRSLIPPDLLADFQTETNIIIELVPYDDDEALGADGTNAMAGDVILASGTVIQKLIAQNRLSVLPARQISNLGHIDPSLRTVAAPYDKGGLHSVPFAWTSYGLGINREAVSAVLGAAAKLDSWALVFDPAKAGKLAACGIHSVATPSIAFPVALKYLQLSPQSDAPGDTERASALWEAARPFIAALDTRSVIEDLGTGKVCVALAAMSDVYQARSLAQGAGKKSAIEFIAPHEGTVMRVYLLALSRMSAAGANGAALINYLLRPEVSARLTNSKGVANAVPGSHLYVRQEIKDDPVISPDVGAFQHLTPDMSPSPATVSLRERFWLLISAGPKAP